MHKNLGTSYAEPTYAQVDDNLCETNACEWLFCDIEKVLNQRNECDLWRRNSARASRSMKILKISKETVQYGKKRKPLINEEFVRF
jgi:hypothetical protein